MTDEQQSSTQAHAEHQEALLFCGAGIVIELYRVFVEKDGSRLVKGNFMLLLIGAILTIIPLEVDHTYIVCIYHRMSNESSNKEVSDTKGLPAFFGILRRRTK